MRLRKVHRIGRLGGVMVAALAVCLLPTAVAPTLASTGTVTEFTVPTPGTLEGIAAGADGALWFTELNANQIGRITIAGTVTEFPIPTPGSGPEAITAGPDGALWFTELNANQIGRITIAGTVTEFPIPTPGSDPGGITAGPDGALWFTESSANQIGRITVAGSFSEFPIPTAGTGAEGITAGPDGALWFAEGANQIGRITTAGSFSEFPIPSGSRAESIAAGPDGALWFTEEAGRIGRITTAGVVTNEFLVPTAGSQPDGIAAGPDGALWFTESDAEQIGRITTTGNISEFPVPTPPSGPNGITAGPDGALWFTEDATQNQIGRIEAEGIPMGWGGNSSGQLGDGTTVGSSTPVQPSGLANINALAGGAVHSLALKSDGTVWAWGANGDGQLGDGGTTTRLTPVQVSGLTNVNAVAAGDAHSLALKSDGTVRAWGYGYWGGLGDGTGTGSLTPVQVSGLTNVTALAAGAYHSLALKSDGTVWAWGYGADGELGDSTTTNRRLTPVQVSGLSNVTALAAGAFHNLALKSDGTVWAWGYGPEGQLGDGATTNRSTPVQVSGLSNVTALAAGSLHSLALKSDGTVFAWGAGNEGQLGDGTGTDRLTPVQVSGLTNVTALAAGAYHSLALNSDGTVWTWGANGDGQLGDGATSSSNAPAQTQGLPAADNLSAGGTHSFAVTGPIGSDVQSGTIGAGGTVSTGGAPSPNDPVETAVTSPTGGTITISESATSQAPPTGYILLGQEVTVTAPAATVIAPLSLVFRIDNSLLPFGTDASNIAITRNGGSSIGQCDTSGHATPTNPCVSTRETFVGYIQITVLTSDASDWSFAVQKRARIVVVEKSAPQAPQDFSFTASGGLSPSSFSLDDDSDPPLDNIRVFDHVTPGSGYSVAEAPPVGWYLVKVTCDNGDNPANITVAAEQTVTCTFVNSRGYPRPRGATPLRASLVPAYQRCTSANSMHGGPPPVAQPSCKPPTLESSQLTVGTPDANTRGANSTGFVLFRAVPGNSSTSQDEADVRLIASLTDVRKAADLSDYTGELAGEVAVQLVDKLNGSSLGEAATLPALPFRFTISCSATPAANVGATCAVTTTADAVIPGFVPENRRSVWQLGQIQVFDGGPDGLASTTADNTLFANQGLFVP